MSRKFHPSVLTANDLPGGAVVYLAPGRQWVHDIALAEILADRNRAEALLAWAETRTLEIIGACLAPIDPASHRPLANRERIRAAGPFSLPRTHAGTPNRKESRHVSARHL